MEAHLCMHIAIGHVPVRCYATNSVQPQPDQPSSTSEGAVAKGCYLLCFEFTTKRSAAKLIKSGRYRTSTESTNAINFGFASLEVAFALANDPEPTLTSPTTVSNNVC
eukprot:5361671-Amphidinium_carterae.1